MKPHGTTIFCDDIRDEVGGKKTYVGVYLHDLVISGPLPALIPSFGFVISYLEPVNFPKKDISIKVFVPDADGKDSVLLDAQIPEGRPDVNDKLSDGSPIEYRVHLGCFKVSPLIIASEGRIKVRAYSDGKEIKLGTLGVRLAKADELEKFGWSNAQIVSD